MTSDILQGVIVGVTLLMVGAGIAVLRTVARLSALVENGMTHQLARIEERVDALYDRLVDK
jgi:hypothetical protein